MTGRDGKHRRGGIATIAGGLLLGLLAAFEGGTLGVAAILLMALGASLLPRAGGPTPTWLHALWIAALYVMAALLGYAVGFGDRV